MLTDLLTEVVETAAVFSEPGWLLRLEGHVEDLPQITHLHAALTEAALAASSARTAGNSNSNLTAAALAELSTAGSAGLHSISSFKLVEDKNGTFTAGKAGTAGRQIQTLPQPDWSDDSDALRGRLLELGGVSGLQTDTDCLLLKDLCRPGLEDNAFLDLIDLELQVRAPTYHVSHVPSLAHTAGKFQSSLTAVLADHCVVAGTGLLV